MNKQQTDFAAEIDAWDGKADKTFSLGSTPTPFKSIGVKDRDVIWHSAKITDILNNHESITRDIIKQVPSILANPVIVLKSKSRPSDSIVTFGEVCDTKGKPVMVALNVLPKNNGGHLLDINQITSVYSRRRTVNLIEKSEVLYIDPNKERADNWFQGLGVRFPSDKTNYGSIGNITYSDEKINISGVLFSGLGQNRVNLAVSGPKITAPTPTSPEMTVEITDTDLQLAAPTASTVVGLTSGRM